MKNQKKRELNIDIEKGIGELESKVKKVEAKNRRITGSGPDISKKEKDSQDRQEMHIFLRKRFNLQKLLSSIILVLVIIIIIATLIYILYTILDSFSDVKVGDYVLKKNEVNRYGVIKDFFTPLVAVVEWNDHEISREMIYNLQKVSRFDDETVDEIISADSGVEYIPVDNRNRLNEYFGLEEIVSITQDESCKPRIFCEEWSGCDIFIDMTDVIYKNISIGYQTRECKDLNGCVSNFIQKKDCSTGEKVSVKKDISEFYTNLNIYDESGKLVVEVKLNKTNTFNPYLIIKVH